MPFTYRVCPLNSKLIRFFSDEHLLLNLLKIRKYFCYMYLFFKMQSPMQIWIYSKKRCWYIWKIEIRVSKKERILSYPKISFDTCVYLTRLTIVVSNRFDTDSKWEKITIFWKSPNWSLFVHHFRPVCLLIMF